ncbi:MAG TPA: TIGR03621 family F420-dependent LLM class oxidoreductase [Acidimicrobiales bacterium]|nr:TIGR03621 family F420-dependent LLM class oxidoreductase [Acidimicrobiales bacterium]
MTNDHKFRFAAQIAQATSAKEWADTARKAEDLGYSTLTLPDHFDDQLAPVPAMMAAAAATTTLRIGTLVFCNDYKHPLILAKEAATMDLLSDGRLELGLGAGWMKKDYEQAGIPYDPPATRVDRFEEAIAIIKGLFADSPLDYRGTQYTIIGHEGLPKPVQRPHPPIVIGGGGKRVLGIAARQADIVSVNPNLKEGLGGAETAPNITPARTTQKVAWVRDAAGERFDDIELNALIGFALVTDTADSIAEAMAPVFGIPAEDALHVPVCLIGTVDFMVDELRRRRDEWGFSYIGFDGGSWEAMAPVVSRLVGT